MKRRTYDHRSAQQLLPMLRSIAVELTERSNAIESLDERLLEARGRQRRAKPSPEFVDLQSDLANHKRELRLAKLEISRLGCMLDEDRALRILIPGSDGSFESGFAWDGTLDRLQRVETAAI